MVFRAIKDFFKSEPEEPVEVTLETMLSSHVSRFIRVYGIELGGYRIDESNATYLIYPSLELPNDVILNLKCKAGICSTYPNTYNLDELGISYIEFEQQVVDYFEKEHPDIKRELS